MTKKFLHQCSRTIFGLCILGAGVLFYPSMPAQAGRCSDTNGPSCPYNCNCVGGVCQGGSCGGGFNISANGYGSEFQASSCDLSSSEISIRDGKISNPDTINFLITVTNPDGSAQELYYKGVYIDSRYTYTAPTRTTAPATSTSTTTSVTTDTK